MSTFTIEVEDQIGYNKSIEDIFLLRRDPSLLIHIKGEGDQVDKYGYQNFCKLAIARKEIQILELKEFKDIFPPVGSTPKCTMNDVIDFLKFAGATIKTFSGENPSQLAPFITNVRLVQSLSSSKPTLASHFLEFIKGQCEGKAHPIASGCDSVQEVIDALQQGIHFDSSDVLESRLTAIQFDNRNLTDFATEVEKIADRLHEALMVEGVSYNKAMSMTINKVVETCRKQARSSVVKSVLASSHFNHPKEVLSKFITEVATAAKERQSQPQSQSSFRQNNGNYRNYDSNNGQNRTWRSNSHNANPNNGSFVHRGHQPQAQVAVRTLQSENENLPTDRPAGEMITD